MMNLDSPPQKQQPPQLYNDNTGPSTDILPRHNTNTNPLKHFKGQDLEMYYMEKKLKPEVEKEIKKGFYEIRKKQFDQHGNPREDLEDEVQVYVSHICLHNFHPIFSKLNVDTVKTFLQYSIVVYLNKGQTLYAPGFNDGFFYIVLFGKCRVYRPAKHQQKQVMQQQAQLEPVGQDLNLGWTIGEEILFKGTDGRKPTRKDSCRALVDSCVLGVERRNLTQIKKILFEKNMQEEFSRIEIVLRGNH
jgi:hypothetical protein